MDFYLLTIPLAPSRRTMKALLRMSGALNMRYKKAEKALLYSKNNLKHFYFVRSSCRVRHSSLVRRSPRQSRINEGRNSNAIGVSKTQAGYRLQLLTMKEHPPKTTAIQRIFTFFVQKNFQNHLDC